MGINDADTADGEALSPSVGLLFVRITGAPSSSFRVRPDLWPLASGLPKCPRAEQLTGDLMDNGNEGWKKNKKQKKTVNLQLSWALNSAKIHLPARPRACQRFLMFEVIIATVTKQRAQYNFSHPPSPPPRFFLIPM